MYFGIPDPYTGKRPVFHLAGYGMGKQGVLLGTDPDGLEFPPIESLWSESARQIGATYRDTVISRREVDIEAQVFGDTMREFRQRREQWFKAWSPRATGHLACFTRYNGWRWLGVRNQGQASPNWGKDPSLIRAAYFDMSIVADDPLWHTFQEKFLWTNAAQTGQGVIKIRNASEYEAHPKFYMPGPGKYSIQDGANGPMVELPELADGETLAIDTHPQRPTARVFSTEGGSDFTSVQKKMRGKRFRNPMQPWTSTELKVSVTGGSDVSQVYSVSSPRFDSPW
ncbi:hypothetical protein CJ179_38320 [Rhodococcus sp. ACS1]|nr:hypothetical protein CJ179_38320 [Rhodococcus sp. ACS1]